MLSAWCSSWQQCVSRSRHCDREQKLVPTVTYARRGKTGSQTQVALPPNLAFFPHTPNALPAPRVVLGLARRVCERAPSGRGSALHTDWSSDPCCEVLATLDGKAVQVPGDWDPGLVLPAPSDRDTASGKLRIVPGGFGSWRANSDCLHYPIFLTPKSLCSLPAQWS